MIFLVVIYIATAFCHFFSAGAVKNVPISQLAGVQGVLWLLLAHVTFITAKLIDKGVI